MTHYRALLGFIGILQIPMGDCWVAARLVGGLVMCAGWLHCSCHVSVSVGVSERLLQG